MATATDAGQAGLQGWREKVADVISRPVAERTAGGGPGSGGRGRRFLRPVGDLRRKDDLGGNTHGATRLIARAAAANLASVAYIAREARQELLDTLGEAIDD